MDFKQDEKRISKVSIAICGTKLALLMRNFAS